MDGGGVGEYQLVEFALLIAYLLLAEGDQELSFLCIHIHDATNVSIIHILVVVVAYLHHPVACAIGGSTIHQAHAHRVQSPLQLDVQVVAATIGAAHRGEHLHIAHRSAVSLRQAVLHQVYDLRHRILWFLASYEEEIRLLAVRDVRETPTVDGVGVHHDAGALRLSEDASEASHGDDTALDDVAQHVASSHGRQLVYVAHQHQSHGSWNRLQQIIH